jgi:cytochrome c oxidase subunit 4
MSGAIGVGTYLRVWGLLLALLALTLGMAYVNAGWLNPVFAVGIAAAKAGVIAVYFMHLRSSSRLVWIVAFAGVLWLAILFALSAGDYLTRGYLAEPTVW